MDAPLVEYCYVKALAHLFRHLPEVGESPAAAYRSALKIVEDTSNMRDELDSVQPGSTIAILYERYLSREGVYP